MTLGSDARPAKLRWYDQLSSNINWFSLTLCSQV
jgi:hypothetical protein